MLLIFLFNVGGYYLALWALEYKTSKELNARIDKDLYTHEETIEIRIPITLPYPLQDRDFERTKGTFEYQGEYYQLVKHKMQGDELVIICIRNQEQKQVVDTITEYVNIANDLPGAAKKALSFFGKLLKDYEPGFPTNFFGLKYQDKEILRPAFASTLISRSSDILSPPPKG